MSEVCAIVEIFFSQGVFNREKNAAVILERRNYTLLDAISLQIPPQLLLRARISYS